MKYSLCISDFLEEISSLSLVFLYFFALITGEGFLISPCYSLELHSNRYIFPFLLCLEPKGKEGTGSFIFLAHFLSSLGFSILPSAGRSWEQAMGPRPLKSIFHGC